MACTTEWNARRRTALRGACAIGAALALACGVPAAAQPPPPQPSAPPALENLNTALDDLTRTPNDVSALLRAGWASLNLGDTQAALGFFRRAEQTAPANGEAKAGEASAMLRLDDPVSAVKLFAAAEVAGAPMARYGSDRGLALDLVGENVAAQRFYRQALTLGNDPETVRRLALSQAISGDERGAEATLLPQLQQQDLSAYRTRAFALAILGKGEEAVEIAEKLMPANLSNRMAPYLRYMPRLTRAQQAAAANLGEFPPASEIGRDSPQIAALSAQNPAPQIAEGGPDSRLVPAGQPLGRSANDRRQQRRDKDDKKARKNANANASANTTVAYAPLPNVKTSTVPAPAPSAPQPTPSPPDRRVAAPPPAQQTSVAPPTRQAAPTPPPVQQASAPPPPVQQQASASPPPVRQAVAQPSPSLPQAPAEQPPAPQPEVSKAVVVASLDQPPAPAPSQANAADVPRPSLSISPPTKAPAASKPVSLADAFADFATTDSPPATAAPGAIDITKIQPVRATPKPPAPKPAPKAKPKPPPVPSRVWVQVGTGRNVKALAFTWRRLQKTGGALLARHDAYSATWGATRRLVTGPYKSEDDAQDAIKALKKKGIDAFEFTSDEGEEVTPLK